MKRASQKLAKVFSNIGFSFSFLSTDLNSDTHTQKNDREALKSDWENVGRDLYRVFPNK